MFEGPQKLWSNKILAKKMFDKKNSGPAKIGAKQFGQNLVSNC